MIPDKTEGRKNQQRNKNLQKHNRPRKYSYLWGRLLIDKGVYPEDYPMLKSKGLVVGKEDGPVRRRIEILAHRAVEWVDDRAYFLPVSHLLAGVVVAIEDAGIVGSEIDEFLLVYKDGIIAGRPHSVVGHPYPAKEAQYRVDSLIARLGLQVVGLPGIKAEGFHSPELPVVVEQGGIVGRRFAQRNKGKSKETCAFHILVTRPEHTHVGHEIAGQVKTGHLQTILVVLQLLKKCCRDALGRLALVIAWEHAIDVGVVHRPKPAVDIHREGVATGNNHNALPTRDLSVLLYIAEQVDKASTEVLLLNLITTHGSHDSNGLLAAAELKSAYAEVVPTGRCHLIKGLYFHLSTGNKRQTLIIYHLSFVIYHSSTASCRFVP